MKTSDMKRRRFLGQCGSMLGALAVGGRVRAAAPLTAYPPALLVGHDDRPMTAGDLEPRTGYVFHYPYVTTPCFLIDLGDEVPGGDELSTADGHAYRWSGGVGPTRSIVAFSAICAHRLTHPTRKVSFIAYRPEPVGFLDSDLKVTRRPGVIQCCSEQSVYDPAHGARVLGGPAPQPLAAIELECDDAGRLTARGVYGGALFEPYFERFGQRLVLEYATFDVEQPVADRTEVMRGDAFSGNTISCG